MTQYVSIATYNQCYCYLQYFINNKFRRFLFDYFINSKRKNLIEILFIRFFIRLLDVANISLIVLKISRSSFSGSIVINFNQIPVPLFFVFLFCSQYSIYSLCPFSSICFASL